MFPTTTSARPALRRRTSAAWATTSRSGARTTECTSTTASRAGCGSRWTPSATGRSTLWACRSSSRRSIRVRRHICTLRVTCRASKPRLQLAMALTAGSSSGRAPTAMAQAALSALRRRCTATTGTTRAAARLRDTARCRSTASRRASAIRRRCSSRSATGVAAPPDMRSALATCLTSRSDLWTGRSPTTQASSAAPRA